MHSFESLLNSHPALPNVWGEGALFAFSGIDGETNTASQFVLTFGEHPFDLQIETPRRQMLRLRHPQQGNPRLITSDSLIVDFPDGRLTLSFSAWHTLTGSRPPSMTITLDQDEPLDNGALHLEMDSSGQCFALSFGTSPAEAQARARHGLTLNLAETLRARLRVYKTLPDLGNDTDNRFLRKCLSVMKVNTLSAEGAFSQHWSTPDRVPHKDLWLWDSVFHSLALSRVDPQMAWETLQSVLERQHADGMIAHQARVNGWTSPITQPPILAWGIWELYQRLRDPTMLAEAAPKLDGYLRWDLAHRDRNRNHLLEWYIEDSPTCRSGESGLDNSQRFDEALTMDAVDFSCFAAQDAEALANIYHVLGDELRADHWAEQARTIRTQIHNLLWDETRGFYFDRHMDGRHSSVYAVSSFLPLLLLDLPAGRVRQMEAILLDPAHFNTAFPIPSISVSDPDWSTDMWRGATWINMNYLVIRGLRQHGRYQTADWLKARTLDHVREYYQQSGVIFEFYDAKDQCPPWECDRKGARKTPYDYRRKMDSIRDYHWTAALCFCLLLEQW